MKKLTINWMDLEFACERLTGEMSFMDETSNFFDKLSGEVVIVDESVSVTRERRDNTHPLG